MLHETIEQLEQLAKARGLERSNLIEALVREEVGREWRLQLGKKSGTA